MTAFDIVVPTIGRSDELERLFESLALQSHREFRVIVVDQNEDERLRPILERFEDSMPITRMTSERGASRARNVGLREASGDAVAFPDDDCWYPANVLSHVDELLQANPDWDGVTGRVLDEQGRESVSRWSRNAGRVDKAHVWTQGVAVSMFLRRRVAQRVGEFDETLGPGAGTPWGAGEETDYLLRAIEAGFILEYLPGLTVSHPQKRADYTPATISTGQSYGRAMGRVLRKHRYPWWSAAYHVGRAYGGAVIALAHGDRAEARFHAAVGRGRAQGWLARIST
jgi:GT2 family glycosyltransferase